MSDLDALGIRYGTDKSSLRHNYLDFYDRHLARFRDQTFRMVEIGVNRGFSLRMWVDYFPNAQVVGLDNNPKARTRCPDLDVVIGDASDPDVLRAVATPAPMVIVDDGSHLWRHQIIAFRTLFPLLAPGGVYVCEDLHTSFGDSRSAFGDDAEGEDAAAFFGRLIQQTLGGAYARQGGPAEDDLFEICRDWVEEIYVRQSALIVQKAAAPASGEVRPWSLATALDTAAAARAAHDEAHVSTTPDKPL